MIQFVSQLEKRLKQELPGEEVQFLMAPLKRERISESELGNFKPRKSAVLILLFPENGLIKTVLIERPVYDGVHSGQIAFPGGKFEEEDIELVNTALRETFEEIGVFSEEIKIIGKLTDIYINPSNFLVSPFIGYMDKKPEFILNTYEVSQIIITDLFFLGDSTIKGTKKIEFNNGFKIKTPYYDVQGFTIWGATAMIISELNTVIEEAKTIFLKNQP